MENSEMLVAISAMLKEQFATVDQRFDTMDQRFDTMDQRFDAMDQRFDAMDQRFDAMDQRFDAMDQRFDAMDQRFDAMDHDFNILKDRTKRIEITLENSVLPRLQNIENCYVSTYQRYADSATKIDTMEADIDVIKTIVAEHISKLQKIS